MYFHTETALFNACRTLFGEEINLSHEFLNYLQPSGAKSAFRNQAKAHHPDNHACSSPQVRKRQTERFREIRQAYDLIIDYLEKRHRTRKAQMGKWPSQAASYWSRKPACRRKPQPAASRPPAIPAIPLEFGMYLYYQGKVTYQQLIEALVWQRRQRPTLGVIAQKWGWLTETRVAQILGHRGQAVRFGKKAVELGYLRPNQVDALLHHQRSLQKRIGQFFIERGLLTEEEVSQVVLNLNNHNSQVSRRAHSFSASNF